MGSAKAAPVIKKLRESNIELGEEDFFDLMHFAAHMFSRVPFYRNWAANTATEMAVRMVREKISVPGYLEKQFAKWEASGKKPEGTIEEFRDYLMDDDAYTVDPHPNMTLLVC